MRTIVLMAILGIWTPGCVNPELRERADRIEILEDDEGYTPLGIVHATVRFENLRPEEAIVIERLKVRAAKQGADAIGQISIETRTDPRVTRPPSYVDAFGQATFYRKDLE